MNGMKVAGVNIVMAGIRISSKSPIATPPRAALSGRSARERAEAQAQADAHSSESSPDSSASEAKTASNREQADNGSYGGEDKDARIAYLEKEMAIMEEEFSREIQTLGEKLTNESEISTYWQQKHSALNQQYLKADTDLHVLRHDVAAREKLREDRDKDVKTRISSLMLDRDTLREGYHLLKTELKHKEDEVLKLKSQVKGLKDFVSTNSRTDGQVTDEVFGEMMQRLGNGMQNWVIQNFRKAKLGRYFWPYIFALNTDHLISDVLRAKEETRDMLLSLVPTYESQLATAKIHLIQSLVSRILVKSIFSSYFVGIPESRAAELQNTEKYLYSTTKDYGKVNQWRASTLIILRNSLGELQPETETIIRSIMLKTNTLINDITDVDGSEARDQSLRALINSSIEMARLLRVQKAVFKTFMPVIEGHQINTFDAETMDDIGGEDEDSLEGREIRCVTFPGMIKEGNENGEQLQLRNVIAKARVLCSPD
jgi:activating signal cointegrator complex subunit 1